jgi:WD40 repeat protein
VCCSTPNSKDIVASGCEGARVCFNSIASDEVIGSIQFDSEDACTSIRCSERDEWGFYCSVGKLVYKIDTRKGFHESSITQTYTCGDEEVNSVSINCDETQLAAGDDAGEIYCFNLTKDAESTVSHYRVLRRGHSNVCSSVLYRKLKNHQLMSSGLDCCMVRWDPTKLSIEKTWTMPGVTTSGMKTINPPMVHCIDTCVDGTKELVAVARGDGCVAIYNADASSKRMDSSRRGAKKPVHANPDGLVWMAFDDDNCHTGSCNAVSFSHGREKTMLLSGGNDCRVKCWDWTADESSLVQELNAGNKVNCIAGVQSPTHERMGVIGDVGGKLHMIIDQC